MSLLTANGDATAPAPAPVGGDTPTRPAGPNRPSSTPPEEPPAPPTAEIKPIEPQLPIPPTAEILPPVSTDSTPRTVVESQFAVLDFALKYAPLVYLHKDESYWPASVAQHIQSCSFQECGDRNKRAMIDVASLGSTDVMNYLRDARVNLESVYMTYSSDPRKQKDIPTLHSVEGRPGADRRSAAPCWIIWMDKTNSVGQGIVDVFYFFFFAYNLGPKVLGVNYGNHVGDWEHVMIRFANGQPWAIHLSEHSDGVSYTFSAVEKQGDRPVVYCAGGSHAFYAKKGDQLYTKWGYLGPVDHTSTGPLMDPALNYVAASYDPSKNEGEKFIPVSTSPGVGKDLSSDDIKAILSYRGKWGNLYDYKGDAPLNKKIWAEGPTGPRDKNLDRRTMNIQNDTIFSKI